MNFRFKALDRQRQPDQLDSPLLLADPRGWIAVFVVLITAVLIGIWGFLGSIPRTVTVHGVTGYSAGVAQVQAPANGVVTAIAAAPAESVSAGQALIQMRDSGGRTHNLTAPGSGEVVTLGVGVGAVVKAGDSLAALEVREGDEDLLVQLAVNPEEVPFVRPGQQVTFAVPGISPRAFGRLRGTVETVSPFPMDERMAQQLGGVDETAVGVAPYQVTVRLINDKTVSGYEWTSADGPPIQLRSQTPVTGEIEFGSTAPFSMLVGG